MREPLSMADTTTSSSKHWFHDIAHHAAWNMDFEFCSLESTIRISPSNSFVASASSRVPLNLNLFILRLYDGLRVPLWIRSRNILRELPEQLF